MPPIEYEQIFEKAEVGIALNDPETGTVGKVNERYAELMGYPREDLRDMPIEEISADDPTFDQEAAMEKIQQALAGDPQRFDWLFERNDGSQFWAEVILKRATVGREDRLLAFVRDISWRKQYEQELEQQNQRLDEFASIVSHDLRTPLNTAMGRLELLRQECDSEYIDDVERAHERMNALIEDVLSLARAGKSVIDTQAVDLGTLSRECWGSIDTRTASLEVETTVAVQADESRLRQLLENLFKNAVVHGGNEVNVSVGDLDNGFFVADDGPGIPEDDRERIFDADYSSSADGTGFGLRIVEQVADAHGWDIRVRSSDDGGALFEFVGVESD